MDRKEFLSLLGAGGAGLAISACFGACQTGSVATSAPVLNADGISLDLTSNAYSTLTTKGSFITHSSGIIIAYGTDGVYYAVQAICPHEAGAITYSKTNNNFPCTKHPRNIFTNKGITNGVETRSNLKTYTCTLNENTLTIK